MYWSACCGGPHHRRLEKPPQKTMKATSYDEWARNYLLCSRLPMPTAPPPIVPRPKSLRSSSSATELPKLTIPVADKVSSRPASGLGKSLSTAALESLKPPPTPPGTANSQSQQENFLSGFRTSPFEETM